MLHKTIISTCIVLGLNALAFGQVKFERKYEEDSRFAAESTSHVEQKLTIAGMEQDTSSDSRSVVQATVGKRDVGGMLKIQQKPESMQINMTVMGQNYSFDSNSPDTKGTSALEILRDVHKALAKRMTTTVLDKENRVYAIESDQDVLSGVPAELQPLIKGQLDPENLKKAANQEIDTLPTEPVNKGDSWQRAQSANLGAGQVMTFQNKFTYEGTVEKNGKTLDKIVLKTLSVDFALQDSPLPLKLKGSELKATESEGTILFDREIGQVVETTNSIRIEGEITFAINDMDLPAKLDLKMQSGVVVKR
jgi:surface antigen